MEVVRQKAHFAAGEELSRSGQVKVRVHQTLLEHSINVLHSRTLDKGPLTIKVWEKVFIVFFRTYCARWRCQAAASTKAANYKAAVTHTSTAPW